MTLSITNAQTLTAANGGTLFFQLKAGGGKIPYAWNFSTNPENDFTAPSGNIYRIVAQTDSGWLTCTPTVIATDSVNITVTDSSGATASTGPMQVNVVNAITFVCIDQTTGQGRLPDAMVGNKYGTVGKNGPTHHAYGGTGTGYVFTPISGSPPGLTLNSSGLWSGTPNTAGNYAITVKVTDSGANTSSVVFNMKVLANQNVTRPAYNTGTGLFVKSGQLYDATNAPFRMRGMDSVHPDNNTSGSLAGYKLAGANTARIAISTPFYSESASAAFITSFVNQQMVPVFSRFYGSELTPGNTNTAYLTSGSNNIGASQTNGAGLGDVVSLWVNAYSVWSAFNGTGILNIANEWGPSGTQQRDAYLAVSGSVTSVTATTVTFSGATNPFNATNVALSYVYLVGTGVANGLYPITATGGSAGAWTLTGTFPGSAGAGGKVWGGAVGILRAVGYTMPLMLDAGFSGQSHTDWPNYAAAIQASDPQQNCIFSLHIYGTTSQISCPITSITKGATTAIGFTSPPALSGGVALNPFQSGITFYQGSSVVYGSGLPQLNGQVVTTSGPGGANPNYTITMNINSSGFTGTASGGYLLDADHYMLVVSQLAALQNSGVFVCVMEFGASVPPLTGSPSPCIVTAGQIIRTCEANGIGWNQWAVDDQQGTFAMFTLVNIYAKPSDLTPEGIDPILNPQYGVTALAAPASFFL